MFAVPTFGKVVIIDLELSCWEDHVSFPKEPEIIEVGVCLLTLDDLRISRPRSVFVSPTEPVSDFCTALTGITNSMLDEKGKTLDEMYRILFDEYHVDRRINVAWGKDIELLQDRLSRTSLEGLQLHAVDLCSVFTCFVGNPTRMGLSEALRECELSFEGTQHRGSDDAWNTARVLRHMILSYRRSV